MTEEPFERESYALWRRAKDEHPEAVVLVRLAQWCRAYEQDARLLAERLGAVLSQRHLNGGRVPFAALLYSARAGWLARLERWRIPVVVVQSTIVEGER